MRDNPNARRFFKKVGEIFKEVGETLEMIRMQLKVVEEFQEIVALDLPDETTRMATARRHVPLLREELFHCTSQEVSDDKIRRGLSRLGYVWNRSRYALLPDPEREK